MLERIETEVPSPAEGVYPVSLSLILLGVYVVRPYNFFLNPVPDEKMNVERIFSYQSGGKYYVNITKEPADHRSRGLPARSQVPHGGAFPRRSTLLF